MSLPRGVPFDAIPCVDPNALSGQLTAAQRIDPYWSEAWGFGARAAWSRHAQLARRQQEGHGKMYAADRRFTPHDALKKLLTDGAFRERRLQVLAALLMWRTLTAEQVAAFVGNPHLAGRAADLSLAFTAGLVDRGRVTVGAYREKLDFGTLLYRPIQSRRASRTMQSLPHRDRAQIGVGDGESWERGSQSDRHNLLTAELALRVAEYTQVSAVVGESASSVRRLVPDPSRLQDSELSKTADAAITRNDGMRIAIELAANVNQKFARKVDGWIGILRKLSRSDADGNVCVLFVEAARIEQSEKTSRAITKTLANAVEALMPFERARVAQRVAFVRWQDWFPYQGEAAASFANLTCVRPVGSPGDLWQLASLLDSTDVPFEPEDEFQAYAALEELHLRWGMPHWLRDDSLAGAAYHLLLRESLLAHGWQPYGG